MDKDDFELGDCVLRSTDLPWRSRRAESTSTDQERVRLRFAVLHLGVVTQNNVVEQTEEVFVLARL